jgi:hypothetical protein
MAEQDMDGAAVAGLVLDGEGGGLARAELSQNALQVSRVAI